MSYVGFDSGNYYYFDDTNKLRFTENISKGENSFHFLFTYIMSDLETVEKISALLKDYCSKKLNLTTFEILSSNLDATNSEINGIRTILEELHPYYKYEFNKVMIHGIGSYFNELLLYNQFYTRILTTEITEAWYMDRILILLKPFMKPGDWYHQDFYDFWNKYRRYIGNGEFNGKDIESDNTNESFITALPFEINNGSIQKRLKFSDMQLEQAYDEAINHDSQPIAFRRELNTQKTIKNMFYFFLDTSAEWKNKLSLTERQWLYDAVYNHAYISPSFSLTKRITFSPNLNIHNLNHQDHCTNIKQIHEFLDKTEQYTFLDYENEISFDNAPEDVMTGFSSLLNLAKEEASQPRLDEYEVHSLLDLLVAEILKISEQNIEFRICRNCGKYFWTTDKKRHYCNGTDRNGHVCSQYGPNHYQKMKRYKSKIFALYAKEHRRRYQKSITKNSHHDESYTYEMYDSWIKKAMSKCHDALYGNISFEDYENWMKNSN